ncbi:L,D-transpeptidase family protein [Marinobacterium weihaiense]|uniref:L,D-transpeptidase family protein n=1 Tax=Marinobacterium weihaiense TaxID=2851016 RepID=A0ABS6M815_9GAMM|nr:L,D-transpeptidase family protein [Marinobacterium weihaiense]MBV0932420.1 L,D-transpeptidase family protein [Marinobacterium weihaiense]
MTHAGALYRRALILLCGLLLAWPVWALGRPLQQLVDAGRQGLLPGVEIRDWNTLERFYAARDWQMVWSDPQGRPYRDRQQPLVAWIALSHEHGLDPRDYGYRRLQLVPGQLRLSSEAYLNDLLMSHAFIELARDFSGSRFSLAQHDPLWRLPPRTLDAQALLEQLARGAQVDTLLRRLLPVAGEYWRLVELHVELVMQAQLPYMPPALPSGLLRVGDRHPELPSLRHWLQQQGLLSRLAGETETGLYTPALAAAVRLYQQQQGLDVDGIYGPDTRAAMLFSPQQKVQQARINLARWRALPHALGRRYLLVRTAAFTLDLVEYNETVQRHDIISGRPQRPSPSFSANIDRLIINPPWTVPFRLAVEDLLPKQQQDGEYFTRLGIEVLAQQQGRWQPVAHDSIDWQGLSKRNFHYLLRQRPGPDNSLGRYRFGMPNPHSIFLHDTPQQSLFSAPSRAFSSGCIRVEAIEQLAARLVDEDALAEAVNGEETHTLQLKHPLPVHLVYLTLWVDEAGGVHYHRDIYGLDARLAAVLGPPPPPPAQQLMHMAQRVLKH